MTQHPHLSARPGHRIGSLVLILLALATLPLAAQTRVRVSSSVPPDNAPFTRDSVSSNEKVAEELRTAVYQELLGSNTVDRLTAALPLSAAEANSFYLCIIPEAGQLQLIGKQPTVSPAVEAVFNQVTAYSEARFDGHSRACLLAGVMDRPALTDLKNPDLRVLASHYPLLPVFQFQYLADGFTTNEAGVVASSSLHIYHTNGTTVIVTNQYIPTTNEACRWAKYFLADQKIAWTYELNYHADGTLDYIDTEKHDVKEFIPKYADLMKTVDAEVTAELEKSADPDKADSDRAKWTLKKAKLKARGLDWQSPAELNPDTEYE